MLTGRGLSAVTLMLLATFILLSPAIPTRIFPILSIPRVHAASRTITLIGNAYGWNATAYGSNTNPAITVTQGDTITIKLSSSDTQHSFVVDTDKDNPAFSATGCPPTPDNDKCSGLFGTSTPMSFTFTVDFGPGTFTYYCAIHYTSMVGNFVVQAPPGPDFSVSSNPSSLTILQGSRANSTIIVTSLNSFAGAVMLSSSSTPGLMTSTFSVNPVMVSAGGAAKSNFTISVPASTSAGAYSLTITGANSTTFFRNTVLSVTVTVPDFTIISSPSSLNIPQGSSETTTITLASLNGFSGTVSLTSTLSSNGPKVTFSPGSLMVPTGGSISSTMNVSAASSGANSAPVSLGSYTVTVTGTSGSLVHSTTVSLTVASTSGIANLPTLAIIGGGVAAALAVVIATVYVLRRRTKT